MFERRIEEAGLNSWPALLQLLYDGWIVRYAQGYTKRANSVTPLYSSMLPDEKKVAWCEQFYNARHLPAVFRLLSFADESQHLETLLLQRGYSFLDHTLVMSCNLSPSTTADTALKALSLDEWLPLFWQWTERPRASQDLHRALLARIPFPTLYAALYQHDTCVACGLGVLEREQFGLFDIVTDPQQRRKGYGTQLVASMLDWASLHGASLAYLQVLATNLNAHRIYTKLGFRENYYYWHRVQKLQENQVNMQSNPNV